MNASLKRLLLNGNVIIIAVLVIAAALTSEHFFTSENILNVLRAASLIGIVAVGMNVVIIAGGIDLSVGSVVALCGAIAASLWVNEAPVVLFVAVPVAVALCVGAANGMLVTLVGLQPFVATLILMTVARGAGLVYTGGQPIYADYPPFFQFLSRGWVFGLPVPSIIFLLMAIVTWYFMTRRVVGREIYAVGANEVAARLSGVNVRRVKLFTYLYCALLAGLAGLVLTSRMESGEPGQAGIFWELDAIAAVVIGGTSLRGGKGSIWGAVVGALIIGIVSNMFNLVGVGPAWQQVAKGAIILIAVMIQLGSDIASGAAFPPRLPSLRFSSAGPGGGTGLRIAAVTIVAIAALNVALYVSTPELFRIEYAKAPYTQAKNLELTRVYNRAIPLYEDIVRDYPDSDYAILARIGIANSNRGLNKLEDAETQYRALLAEAADGGRAGQFRYDILSNLAALVRDKGDTDKFTAVYEELARDFPDSEATRDAKVYLDGISSRADAGPQTEPAADMPVTIAADKLALPERIKAGETFDIVIEVAPKGAGPVDFSLLTGVRFWRGFKLLKVSPNPLSVAEFWGRQSWSFAGVDKPLTVTATVQAEKPGTYEFDLDVEMNFDVIEAGITRAVAVEE